MRVNIVVNIVKTIEKVENLKFRSTWQRAVQEDAGWLLWEFMDGHYEDIAVDVIAFENIESFERALRNGAESWEDFSEGGSALIYNKDIAEHYCTPSELKKNHNGEKAPNSKEGWLDVQARALQQAALMIKQNLVTE